MISTREQLREFLVTRFDLSPNAIPDFSRDQLAECWGKLDTDVKHSAVGRLFHSNCKSCETAASIALNASPLTLCIAVARALGETVEIP